MRVASPDDIAARRQRYVEDNGNGYYVSPIFGKIGVLGETPQAFMLEPDPGVVIDPHFHVVDQFQFFLRGQGAVGRKPFAAPFLHFTDPYTTYGPIAFPEADPPCAFITFRIEGDNRQRYMPASRDEKHRPSGRNLHLFNGSEDIDRLADPSGCAPVIAEDDGLGVFVIDVAADGEVVTPPASHTRGQYWVVLSGTMVVGDAEFPEGSCALVGAAEEAHGATAGHDGLKLVVLRFPRSMAMSPTT